MISLRKAAWMVRHPRYAARELKVVRELATSAPVFTLEPWLEKEDVATLDTLLDPQRAVVEYGSGSSTPHLAARSLAVHSVDSSRSYVAAVKAEAARRNLFNVHLTPVDLGPVRDWGWPIDHYPTSSNVKKWRRYIEAPWETIGDTPVSVVLVDGRFRVACAAYAIGQLLDRGDSKATVFLDDFVGREETYGGLRAIADLVETAGRGVLVKPTISDSARAFALADQYITDLR